MTRKGIYVGIGHDHRRQPFLSTITPTEHSHGAQYAVVIGPFRTRRAATFMARYGENNPHLQTVADAERISRR